VAEVAIVGAGLAGLAASAELAAAGHGVTVLDRVPVTGGVLGYRQPLVRELTGRAIESGVTLTLGTTALRWEDRRLLSAGPGGIAWSPADRVVICSGHRPRTLAEMRIAGARLSGVLPVTAAVHLLESGATLGRRLVVLGDGWWSRRLAAHAGPTSTIVAVSPDPAAELPFAGELWAGWEPVGLRGVERVTGVLLTRDGVTELVSCDAVVTAQVTVPYRNVDGALEPGVERLRFVQPLAGTAEQSATAAREAAATIVTEWGGC
jgi:NADPH-dependent 2,4-dienoyl-CoA reductase/sulfur reductase-like enzyme